LSVRAVSGRQTVMQQNSIKALHGAPKQKSFEIDSWSL